MTILYLKITITRHLDVIFIDELVDINTPGFYEIQIIATDISNNKNGSTQVVEVRDTTSPILNLKYHTINVSGS